MAFNRYQNFIQNGTMEIVPFIPIPKKNTDYYTYYELGKTRLDILSYEYYNNPNYGWLILQANPEYNSLEFNIPNKALLRIPYPLDTTINQYITDIKKYKQIN